MTVASYRPASEGLSDAGTQAAMFSTSATTTGFRRKTGSNLMTHAPTKHSPASIAPEPFMWRGRSAAAARTLSA